MTHHALPSRQIRGSQTTLFAGNHTTSLEEAIASVRRHLNTLVGRVQPGDRAGAFDSDQVARLLRQEGCTALRIYQARNARSQRTCVLAGVNVEGNDMSDGILMQEWAPCPPFCPADGVLLGMAKQGDPHPYPGRPLPSRDHTISLDTAVAYTRRHRDSLTGPIQAGDYAGSFDAEQILALLEQPGCVALRIYHGRTGSDQPTFVLAGARADGTDITDGVLLQYMLPCPPYSALGSALHE